MQCTSPAFSTTTSSLPPPSSPSAPHHHHHQDQHEQFIGTIIIISPITITTNIRTSQQQHEEFIDTTIIIIIITVKIIITITPHHQHEQFIDIIIIIIVITMKIIILLLDSITFSLPWLVWQFSSSSSPPNYEQKPELPVVQLAKNASSRSTCRSSPSRRIVPTGLLADRLCQTSEKS